MALITEQITSRNYELIRDKIGAILTLELAGQTYVAGLSLNVWSERKIPFNLSELPAVNISYNSSTFDNKNQSFKRGDNKFFIDIYASEPSITGTTGDILASKKAGKIAGIIDYILEHPIYSTLGFTPGFIVTTIVEQINIGDLTSQDTNHNIVARLQFKVVAGEDIKQIQPTEMDGYDTQVKLELTDKGFLYTLNND